jgi:L-threonylcarbamoyladenylate synthase
VSKELRRAAEILRAGGLVAFPTETVYGLGADASSEKAMARLYRVKGRPADHPVIVHFASAAEAFKWGEATKEAKLLAERFWPGPLTLILRRNEKARDFVTGGQPSVGVRVPSHPIARELLKEFGKPIAAPSANRFGQVSPTTAGHVRDDLGSEVDLVLEGGPSEVGIESTIVDLSSGTPALLRPGRISRAELQKFIELGEGGKGPRHSGGLEKHYAPKTPARLVPAHELDREIVGLKAGAAVLAFSRPDERVDFWLRMPRDPETYAQKLYAALREVDGANCRTILIESPPAEPAWEAVLDRLRKATVP